MKRKIFTVVTCSVAGDTKLVDEILVDTAADSKFLLLKIEYHLNEQTQTIEEIRVLSADGEQLLRKDY